MKTASKFYHHISKCILYTICLFLWACSEKITDNSLLPEKEVTENWIIPEVLQVNLPHAKTKVSYTDNNTNGVKQNWESGDQFILYNTNGQSATYTVSSISSENSSIATFTRNATDTAIQGGSFYAVYKNGSHIDVSFKSGLPVFGLSMTGQTQSGTGNDALSHLKAYDLIVSNTITSPDQNITFTSQGSLLTFQLSKISTTFGAPTTLTINVIGASNDVFRTNYNALADTSSFQLSLSGYDSLTTSLTAYMMIPPFSIPADANLGVVLQSASSETRYEGSFTSEKDYLAANRYNFPISSFTGFENYTQEMDNINAYYDDGWGTKYKPENGTGIKTDPYLIETAWNLAWLKAMLKNSNFSSYNTSDIYYKLTTNIFIEDSVDWLEIGATSGNPFNANFDGDGNEITNMSIEAKNSHVGFFGVISGGSVSNLTVRGHITASGSEGSFFGGIVGSSTNGSITYCNNYVTVSNPAGGSCGGILGYGTGSTIISDCNNYAPITSYTYAGGIMGQFMTYADSAQIINCNNYGTVTGLYREVGGIIGFANASQLVISYCKNTANVTGGTVAELVGGIVGSGYANMISNCENQGTITGTKYVGTIIGQNSGSDLGSGNTNTGTANGGTDSIGNGN